MLQYFFFLPKASLSRNPRAVHHFVKYDLWLFRYFLSLRKSPPPIWILQRWSLLLSIKTVCLLLASLYDAAYKFYSCWPGLLQGVRAWHISLKTVCAKLNGANAAGGHLAAFKSPTRKSGFNVLSTVVSYWFFFFPFPVGRSLLQVIPWGNIFFLFALQFWQSECGLPTFMTSRRK